MAKIGDTVRYLNSVGGGRITRIDGQMAYVDDDGFETPVLLKECVVVAPAADTRRAVEAQTPASPKAPATPQTPAAPKAPEIFVVEETEGGEQLNVVLAYEAVELKRLSTTTYDTYLVNDSNYYLHYTYLTRADGDRLWTLRHTGVVEPGIQVFIGEVQRDDLAEMDRICLQLTAYKRGKEFELKPQIQVESALDTTKFCKLHCFQPNPYFDQPVIAIPVVRDDVPYRQTAVDPRALQQALSEKQREERHAARAVQKKQARPDEPLVIDLHIDQLVDTTAGLSSADMLNLQIDHFRRVMDDNLRRHGRKIVFIHGKGEGVLRKALLKELAYRYKGCDVQDASFREYGFGATQVRIK